MANWEPGGSFTMSDEAATQWQSRLTNAENVGKKYHPRWQTALDRYMASKQQNYDVNALKDYRHVESKKASLFFNTPEVQLHPCDVTDPAVAQLLPALVPLRQRVLNYCLGRDGTRIKAQMHRAIFDCLAPSGLLVTELGYDVRLAPARDETGAEMKDQDGKAIEIPIWGKPFWVRVSPKKLLIPAEWTSTDFDDAPFLALRGTMPLAVARKARWALPADYVGSTTKDPYVFQHEEQESGSMTDKLVEYTKVWYRASVYDADVLHPELYRCAVFVKGVAKPVLLQNSPFQGLLPDDTLDPSSMLGNPIHVGTLRELSDSAYVASDLTVMEQLSHEINKFRTTQVRARIANMPITVIDPAKLPAEEVEKLRAGEKIVFCHPGELMNGGADAIIGVATPGQQPRDNYTAQDYAERDLEGAIGTGANQAGSANQKRTTATEVRTVQGNSDARSEQERERLREYFVIGTMKFDAILQRVLDQRDVVKILGQDAAKLWAQWRVIAGKYTYYVLPDAGIHVDAEQFKAQKINEYNMFRKDPQINATELLKATMRSLGYDPAKIVVEQPPEPGPEPARLSLAFKGDDLVGPQSQAVVEILAQAGYAISPAAIEALKAGSVLAAELATQEAAQSMAGDQEHGGSASRTEPVNQHQTERTGATQGVGI